MAVSEFSPNVDNYTLSKGVVKWKPNFTPLVTTADVSSGSNAATLASAAGLQPGQLYSIAGTDIAASSVFYAPDTGDAITMLALALSSGIYMPGAAANATGTSGTAAVTINSEYRHVGNVTDFEFTPNVDRLEHYSQMEGTKKRDKVVARQLTATMRVVMEEWTPQNLSMMLMGTVLPGSPIIIDILDVSQVAGAFRFIGRNDVGVPVQLDFTNVNITPTSALSVIGDDWGKMEVSAEVLADAITGRFGRAHWNISGEVIT